MGMRLSLLATAATAAVFLSTGTVAGAATGDGRWQGHLRDHRSEGSGGAHRQAGGPAACHCRPPRFRDGERVLRRPADPGRLRRAPGTSSTKPLTGALRAMPSQDGETYFLESKGAGPNPAALAGHVRIIGEDGKQRTLGDFAALETEENADGETRYGYRDLPDGCAAKLPPTMPETYEGEIDSHPYGIALTDETIYVADAGANSVVSVDTSSGETETVAVLPPRPYEDHRGRCGRQRPAGLRGGNDLRLRGRPDRRRRRGGRLAVRHLAPGRTGRPERSAPAGRSSRWTRTATRWSSWPMTS